ncbi:MAG: Nif3-like dinuclear metal center hexameric protein [Pedobacter sp.]|nr:MAG: Nif3-like dinuclear metal center hexameric protein [Pedobacter sp.]
MTISEIISHLEIIAPPSLQESYDNAGLITGNASWECKGVLVCLDSTPDVIKEAIEMGCNLIVAHHPIVFKGLKKINGKNYIEEAVILAIRNDIAIYAIHTNLDNVIAGVSGKMADLLSLTNRSILFPKAGLLQKLIVFVPVDHKEQLKNALFAAGAGSIGNYSECSFETDGRGTFRGGGSSTPFVGEPGTRHTENEVRLEVIFPSYAGASILAAMNKAHPYEEVAYDLVNLANEYQDTGSGLVGDLEEPVSEKAFLSLLKEKFALQLVRHSPLRGKPVKTVALCGGAGSFLISKALASGADVFVTADMKYHEFFDANGRLVICDIGHFESEQFTVDLLYSILREKFISFAVLKTKVKTNPVNYFV